MKIAFPDYLLARFSHTFRHTLKQLGDWETSYLESKLGNLKVSRPVFICGLARSGSTILLELLSQIAGVASHRYRDFPFQAVPWIWNNYLDRYQVDSVAVERPHGDRIHITRESPEAMEEPLWMTFFKNLHSTRASQLLTGQTECRQFSEFYDAHLRKILLIRNGSRYVSKNNYNVGRIGYLAKLYPDAHFVVPIRHPVAHTHSLVSQHLRFCNFAHVQPRVAAYLQAAGHYEFGPQRIPIQFDTAAVRRTLEHWNRGDDYRGYAVQWSEVYDYIRRLRTGDEVLSSRIHVVRYEDFCESPAHSFTRLLQQVDLADSNPVALDHISAPSPSTPLTSEVCGAVWTEVSNVATDFGYEALPR